MLKNYAI